MVGEHGPELIFPEQGAETMPKNTRAGGPSYEPGFADDATMAELPQGKSPRALEVERAGEVEPRSAAFQDRDPGTFAESGGLAAEPAEPGDQFDPAEYTVDEVNRYLDDCRDEENQTEFDRVILAESKGKNRVGILNRTSG
jgi:hypothetical protein